MRRTGAVVFLLGLSALVVMCVAAPVGALTLDTPNGKSYLASGTRFVIRWSNPGEAQSFNLSFSLDGGRRWRMIARGLRGSEYAWKVPVVARNEPNCLVRVQGYRSGVLRNQDRSDRRFGILAVRLAEPNGDETFMPGQVVRVAWRTFATRRLVASASLSYTIDGGRTWRQLVRRIRGNPGSFAWTVPASLAGRHPSCKVRVELRDRYGTALATDASDAVFSIGMVEVAADTVVLDAASLGKLSAYDSTLRELRFSGWTPQLKRLVAGGNTLVAGIVPGILDAGLLGKVMGIRAEAGQVVITLGDAGLDSVFDNATASLFHTLKPEDLAGPLAKTELEPGVRVLPRRSGAEMKPEVLASARAAGFEPEELVTLEISKVIPVKADFGGGGTCSYYGKIFGEITIGIDFDVSASVGWTGLKKFSFDTRPFVASGLGVEATGTCQTGKTWTVAHFQTTPFNFQVGPVPVIFVPYLDIDVGYDLGAQVKVRLEAMETLQAATGVSYKRGRDPAWKSYFESSADFAILASAELTGNVTASVTPSAGLRLYGVTGPNFGVMGYLELRGAVNYLNRTVDLGIYAGYKPFVGADVKLFGLWEGRVDFAFLEREVLLWPSALPPKVTLAASRGLEDRVALSWDGGEMTPLFEVWRAKVSPPEGYSLLATVGDPAYDDTGADPEYDYSYYVVGKNRNGAGPASEPGTGWMMIKAPLPSISQGLYKDWIAISWPRVNGAGGYFVYRDDAAVASLGSATTSFSDTSALLVPAVHYTYKVEAKGAGPHQTTRTSLPLEGWMSKCDHPQGRWDVTIGPCGQYDQWQPESWSFDQGSVTMAAGTYPFVWDPNTCVFSWSSADSSQVLWSGTMDNVSGLTMQGTSTRPIPPPPVENCWTATRRAPDPVDPSTIPWPQSNDDGTYTISWAGVLGAHSYIAEYMSNPEGGWVPVPAGDVSGTSATVPYWPHYFQVRAVNSAGQSTWTTKDFWSK